MPDVVTASYTEFKRQYVGTYSYIEWVWHIQLCTPDCPFIELSTK